jgi:hypothetical protein
MARVFLSHSSRDNVAAAELKTWLDGQGFAPAFPDFDKHSGIPPGADWERTLYEQIQRCQALLIPADAELERFPLVLCRIHPGAGARQTDFPGGAERRGGG